MNELGDDDRNELNFYSFTSILAAKRPFSFQDESKREQLTWNRRFSIIQGICSRASLPLKIENNSQRSESS